VASRDTHSPLSSRGRFGRNTEIAKLGVKVGTNYATTAARKLFASAERKEALDQSRELKNAAEIAERLGNMKGALMKLGQMASYLDNGLPEPLRLALAELQNNAPPMSGDLARRVVEEEFGAPVAQLFVEWDDEPIASASIGQVHRAIIVEPATGEHRAVAVKVQYPGVAEAIAADLKNADLLGAVLAFGFKAFEPEEMVAEIKERLAEELDYTREAKNQREFADFYTDHPFVNVPRVHTHLSSSRVITSDLVTGSTWNELMQQPQDVRDRAAEAIFRYVFRSLYRFRAFNGDPHPGNYIFHVEDPENVRITFLDYGLVKHFTEDEMTVFKNMISAAAINHDDVAFRQIIEDAGLLKPDAPVTTDQIGDYFSHFYAPVRESHVMHSCATPSIAQAPSPTTHRFRAPSSSSSASTSASTHSSANFAPTVTTVALPRNCGPWSTPRRRRPSARPKPPGSPPTAESNRFSYAGRLSTVAPPKDRVRAAGPAPVPR
jgi:predicted unusual protein kinase regulating ubiquinone biosynthesis (AarF/ABC1/UbiB family)